MATVTPARTFILQMPFPGDCGLVDIQSPLVERLPAFVPLPRFYLVRSSGCLIPLDARLLVASNEGTTPTVRFAHEALMSHWQRAQEQAHQRTSQHAYAGQHVCYSCKIN